MIEKIRPASDQSQEIMYVRKQHLWKKLNYHDVENKEGKKAALGFQRKEVGRPSYLVMSRWEYWRDSHCLIIKSC